MGIKYLNKYLRTNCKESIVCISLNDLSGKVIVVDVSIYLYRYEGEDVLIENMYLLLSIFRKYNIIPIFIFDGKSPVEKKALIQKRIDDRKDAEKELNILKKRLEILEDQEDEKQDVMNDIYKLKKKIIYITKEKIDKVKNLITSYGATYYDAPYEADELCAELVNKKKAWACLSEDMDMFVYGCSRVLRYISLLNHTVVLYNYKGILKELDIISKDFQEICIIAGTDYNINNNINIFILFKYFNDYKKNQNKISSSFCEWLEKETDIDNIDLEMLEKIKNMFKFKENANENVLNKIKIINSPIQYDNLQILLEDNGFIFV
jgi:5'-3' exonuclease